MTKFKIRKRDRIDSSPRWGESSEWTEYQVVEGRKVVYRAGSREAAERYIQETESQR